MWMVSGAPNCGFQKALHRAATDFGPQSAVQSIDACSSDRRPRLLTRGFAGKDFRPPVSSLPASSSPGPLLPALPVGRETPGTRVFSPSVSLRPRSSTGAYYPIAIRMPKTAA